MSACKIKPIFVEKRMTKKVCSEWLYYLTRVQLSKKIVSCRYCWHWNILLHFEKEHKVGKNASLTDDIFYFILLQTNSSFIRFIMCTVRRYTLTWLSISWIFCLIQTNSGSEFVLFISRFQFSFSVIIAYPYSETKAHTCSSKLCSLFMTQSEKWRIVTNANLLKFRLSRC